MTLLTTPREAFKGCLTQNCPQTSAEAELYPL